MHTDKIFPEAIYLTAKETIGREKAYQITEGAAVRICAEVSEKLAKLMMAPGMRSLFVAVWDSMTKKMFGKDCGFQNVFYPKKKREYKMSVLPLFYCARMPGADEDFLRQ